MANFNLLPFKFPRKKAQNRGIDPSVISTQPVILKPSTPAQSSSKSLASLAKQAEKNYYTTYGKPKRQGLGKFLWTMILIGIPVGIIAIIIWAANLPYPVIRRPVAQNAPILLLPSYITIDSNYRQAITAVEQAERLINQATSPADLELGEQKVKAAQQHLDKLPTGFLKDLPEYRYWWYDSYFSIYGFNTIRKKVGELETKVFQEKNAQILLTDSEQELLKAKQHYQQASTPTDKQLAIADWRSAIDQLEQIPGQTLAGKTVQANLNNYKRDFKEVVGLVAGNERTMTLILVAQQFSWQAAKAAQNPPHSVAKWEQIENLWKEAIQELERISDDDLAAYRKAQELLAQYKANLGQIKIRRQEEADAVKALEKAQSQIQILLRITPTNANDVNGNSLIISQLQGIIYELEKISNGTTPYLEAQQLLLSAQNKLNQLQP